VENRKTEIAGIVPAFNAVMMDLISRHRQKQDALNQVPGFVEAIEFERKRMTGKLGALLSNPEYASLVAEIHDAQQQVNALCDSEIARAQASKTVEFNELVGLLGDMSRSLDSAVNRIDRKEK
jgi:hypothetical protein